MATQQRVLVTGGAGFVGSHIADRFAASGADVVVVDNLITGRRENVRVGRFVELDITEASFVDFLRKERFDLILHFAAQIDVRHSVARPDVDALTNILGTLNVLEGARRSDTRPRVIFSSTGGALYAPDVSSASEWSDKKPDSPYGVSKLAAEHYITLYNRLHGLESVVLRFANVYGPRQNAFAEAGVVAIFCKKLLSAEPLTIYGDGEQVRDFIYVGDITEAAFRAATLTLEETGVDGPAFNIASGLGTSVLDLAETLQKVAGINASLEFAPARPGEIRASRLSPQKAVAAGLLPHITNLADGLRTTFDWFSERHAVRAPVGRESITAL